jgi:hypothetical protein
MEELENLYNVISGEGLYTKSFDEFKTQFSDATYQDKVFKAVSEKGFYTKDINSFKQKYVGGAPKQSKALGNEVKTTEKIIKPHISYDQLTQSPVLPNVKIGDIQNLPKSDQQSIKELGQRANDKEFNMVKNLEEHYKGEGFTFSVQDEWGWNDIVLIKDKNGRSFKIDTNSRIYKKDPVKYLKRFHSWAEQSRKDDNVEPSTGDFYNIHNYPKLQELKTKLREVPSMSQEAADIDSEIKNIENAIAESKIEPNNKRYKNNKDIVDAHNKKVEEITNRVLNTASDQGMSYTEALTEAKKQVKFWETNNPNKTAFDFANYEVNTINKALEEISTYYEGDDYSAFDVKSDEKTELHYLVERQIIEDLSLKEMGKAAAGGFNGADKEKIITNAKHEVLTSEYKKYEQISKSKVVLDFVNKRDNIFQRIEQSTNGIPKDDDGNLIFSTQKQADDYNNLVKSYQALEKEGENIKNTLILAEEKFETIQAELAYNAVDGVFKNNFEATAQYEEWRDNHIKNRGFWGGTYDAAATFVQEGVNIAADATIGLGVSIAGFADIKLNGENKYYDGHDIVQDFYERYAKYNYLGVSDLNADILDKDGNYNWENGPRVVTKTIAEMLPFTIGIILAAAKGNPKPAKNLYNSLTSEKGRQTIRMMDASYRMTINDNFHEGKSLGLSDDQAFTFSNIKSFATGLSQAVMPDINFLGTAPGRLILNSFIDNLKKATTKKAIGVAVKNFTVNLVKELGEEELELVGDLIAKHSVGLAHSPVILDLRTQKETIAATLMLSGSLGSIGAVSDYKAAKKQVYDQYRNKGQDIISLLDDNLKVAEGKLKNARTQESKNNHQATIDQINKAKDYGQSIINAINSAPENVSDDQIDLLIQKQNLVNQKQGKDKAISIGIDNQIKKIDEKISNSVIIQEEGKQAELRLIAVNKATATVKKQMASLEEETGAKGQVIEMSSLEIAETQAEQVALLEAEVEGYKEEISNLDPKSKEYKKIQKQLEDSENLLDGITNADTSYGYIVDYSDGSYDLILNTDKPMVGTAAHEFQHKVLARTLKNNSKLQNAFGDALIEYGNKLGGFSPAFIDRMSAYINPNTGKQISEFGEEVITVMSESILDGSLKFDESLFVKIGDIIRQTLQRAGIVDIKFDTGRDVYNFVKDYKRSIDKGYVSKAITKMAAEGAKGKLTETATDTKAGGTKFSKFSALESINNLIPSDVKTKEDYQEFVQDRKRFAPLGKALEENGVISNYVKSKSVGDEYIDAMESVTDRVIGLRGIFNPERLRKDGTKVGKEAFGEFIFANTNFAKRDAKKALAIRKIESDKTTSIDTKEVREIEDQSTINESTSGRSDSDTKKTNVLNFTGVSSKINELMDVVDIMPVGSNTFKTVDEYTGKAAEIIFDIPAEKATKGNKNLSHKTKVVNGMMELSQAGKIQDFFRVGDNLEKLVKIMVPENVTSKTADISEVGENIDVARDIYGRSIGLKGKVLEYFFDKTGKRSQGLTTQPNVWELKPEFKNPSKETLDKLRSDLGITPQGQANVSDRAFNGQLLKGVAEYQAYQTALSITQRKLDAIKQEATTKEEKSAISQDIANVTAAQSRLAFSKSLAGKIYNDSQIKHGSLSGRVFGVIGTAKITYASAKRNPDGTIRWKTKSVRDLFGWWSDNETGEQARNRVANNFLSANPQYRDILRNTMSGGETISLFKTKDKFDSAINSTNVEQSTINRFHYNKKKLLTKSALEKIRTKEFKANELAKTVVGKQFWLAVQSHLKNNPNDVWFFEEMLVDSQNNQGAITRIIALFTSYPVDKKGQPVFNREVIEEHSSPQIKMARISLAAAKDGNIDDVWPVIEASYMQMSLLASDDAKVRAAGLSSNLPDIFWKEIVPRILDGSLNWLPKGYASFSRYAVAGVDLNGYKLLSGETVTEFFGVSDIKHIDGSHNIKLQNDIILGILTGKFQLGYGQSIANVNLSKENSSNAINSSAMSFSRTANPAKGISVLDFDDTLATTKSGVRYTLPNPDHSPQPKKKVIFMAGGPGSGKSNVINQLGLKEQGFKVVNQDISLEWLMKNHGMPTDMREFTPEQASEFGKLSA